MGLIWSAPIMRISAMKAFGRRDTMLVKMMRDMPLPRPYSLICSPSHMIKAVPVVKDSTHMK